MNRRPIGYSVAVVAAVLAVGATAWADAALARGAFLLPVMATAAVSIAWGVGPGLVTTALAAMLTAWWILPPSGPAIATVGDRVALGLFVLAGAIAVAMGEALRRGWRSAFERESALRRSEAFYRSLIENATDLTSVLAPDGTNQFVSPATHRFLGYTPEERVGRSALDLVHPDDRPAVQAALGEVIRGTRGERPIEFRFLTRSGTWRWLESTARNLLDDPDVGAVVINSRDVTDRRTAERQIRFQAHLLDAVGQAVIATDPDGRVRYMNVAAEALTGWTLDEARGRPGDEIMPGRGTVCSAGEDAAGGPVEFALRHREGTVVPVLATESRLQDANGGDEGAVTILVDIAERKRTEARLREHEEKLQQVRKLEAIGRLAGGVAHDFNNLLTGIRGFAQFAQDQMPVGSPVHDDLEEILRSADRAASLTGQLLAFGRRQVLRASVLDLNAVVGETGRLLHRLIGEDIRIDTRLAGDLGRVKADPGQVEQVLVNLALNARDAMPTGGVLTVETSDVALTEDDDARSSFDVRPGRYVQMVVRDTGHGMDAATLDRVFEPFFTTKPMGQGTGLGLSTVYGIVKQSGGYVWVDSAPGAGTTVRICLPRVDAPASAPRDRGTARPAGGGHETVLLVEDDDTVRALTRRVLDRQGYQVLEARNGVEALRIAEPELSRIHLVISDVVMPELGGRQLVERLREIRPELPVLLMSGYTDDAIVRHGITESGEPFLPKPFTTDALARKVRAILDAKTN